MVRPDGQGNDRSPFLAISQGGRFVAFKSYADNLVAEDTNGFSDLYAYNRQTGAIERLSFKPDGAQFLNDAMTGSGGAISTDGSRATFDAWPAEGMENQVWLRQRDIAAVNTDLTLENVTIWPAQIKQGQPFDVTVTVRNTGAAGHFAVNLYVDPATTPVLCNREKGAGTAPKSSPWEQATRTPSRGIMTAWPPPVRMLSTCRSTARARSTRPPRATTCRRPPESRSWMPTTARTSP